MSFLRFFGIRVRHAFQIQLSPCAIPHDGFRPYLVNLRLRQISEYRFCRTLNPRVHRPEAAVPRLVLQKVVPVGRSEEYALAGKILRPAFVGDAVAVYPLAHELLDPVLFGTVHRLQLADLDDPFAADNLAGVLALKGLHAVGKPFTAQTRQKGAFADALRAGNDQRGIKFNAGAIGSGDGSAQALSHDCPRVDGVLYAEIVGQQRVKSFHAVPDKPVEIIRHGVELVLCHMQHEGVGDDGSGAETQYFFRIASQSRVVRIRPFKCACPVGTPLPRQRGNACDHLVKFIVLDASGQCRIIFQHSQHISDALDGHSAVCGGIQPVAPVFVAAHALEHTEIALHLRHTLPPQQAGHFRIGCRKLRHGRVGRQSVGRRVLLRFIVQITEAVQPYQVKGIDKPLGTGVGGVVAVEESAALVNHRAAHRGAAEIGEAVAVIRDGFVYFRQVFFDCRVNVVCPAERADNALFLGGIALFCRQLARRVFAAGNLRPLRHVLPVGVHSQNAVFAEKRFILIAEHIIAVCAAAWPVHQARRFKGGGVK